MKIIYPQYYDRFRCLAGACPDSCCKEWTVDVDQESARFYRSLEGALGDRLRSVLQDGEDGAVMTIENGRCPMWRSDGLCRIQAELGHDALCKTCRDFPRLRHDYGDFVELGLELSCPEAARLILTEPGTLCTRLESGGEQPDYDPQIMEMLLAGRAWTLRLLDSESYPLPQSLAIMLLYGHELQYRLDGGEGEDPTPEICLADAEKYATHGDCGVLLNFFSDLELLTLQWKQRLENPAPALQWQPQLRSVARYLVSRYYLQAVADYDIVSRVKLVVTSCLLLAALGGDPVETAQLFSKEIENDPDNIEAILDGAYIAPALTDANLLGLLLGK